MSLDSTIHRQPVAGQMDLNMDSGIQISYGSSSESQLSTQSISIHLFNISKRKHKETYQLQCVCWLTPGGEAKLSTGVIS